MSQNPLPKFAYFGTPAVAAETLEEIISEGFVPSVVITAPPAPRGRGLVLTPSETNVVANEHGIPVLAPAKLNDEALAAIASYDCAFAVVVAYGKMFPTALIESFPMGAINVHYSLLPKYRGATPMESALLAGDTETGVTVQQMAPELDAGDVLAQEKTLIGPEETARELRPRLIELGALLLIETLPSFARGELVPLPQDASLATRAKKSKKEDGLLDLAASGEANWRKYRAYADTIGTHFFKDGTRYKVVKASFAKSDFKIERVVPEGKSERDWN